jgi:hypothetical protein
MLVVRKIILLGAFVFLSGRYTAADTISQISNTAEIVVDSSAKTSPDSVAIPATASDKAQLSNITPLHAIAEHITDIKAGDTLIITNSQDNPAVYYIAGDSGIKSFDYGSFFGALLGAILSGIVAILVFVFENKRQRKNKKLEFKQLLEVFILFIDEVEQNMKDALNSIINHKTELDKGVIDFTEMKDFPDYFLNRIRDVDVIAISKAFFEYKIDNKYCVDYIKSIEYLNVMCEEVSKSYLEYSHDIEDSVRDFRKKDSEFKRSVVNDSIRSKKLKELWSDYPGQSDTQRYTITVMREKYLTPLRDYFNSTGETSNQLLAEESLSSLNNVNERVEEWKLTITHYETQINKVLENLKKCKSKIGEGISKEKRCQRLCKA